MARQEHNMHLKLFLYKFNVIFYSPKFMFKRSDICYLLTHQWKAEEGLVTHGLFSNIKPEF